MTPEIEELLAAADELVIEWYSDLPPTRLQAAADAVRQNNGDPIETGREAALGQWEARWAMLRDLLQRGTQYAIDATALASIISFGEAMDRIEAEVPTGLPVGERWVPRVGGRVNLQLEPERAKRLIEVLKSAGAHPSGLGSYEAANDANTLADDLSVQIEGQ